MTKVERRREVLTSPPTAEQLREKTEEGWRLVAVEWERDAPGADQAAGLEGEEIPYGLEVAADHLHLVENPLEIEVVRRLLEQIVTDQPLSAAADELNRRGYRQRSGTPWNQVALFNLLPRVVELAPRIYSSEEWHEKRARLKLVVG